MENNKGRVRNIVVSDLTEFRDVLCKGLSRSNINYVRVNNEFHFFDRIYRFYTIEQYKDLAITIDFAGKCGDMIRVLDSMQIGMLKDVEDFERTFGHFELGLNVVRNGDHVEKDGKTIGFGYDEVKKIEGTEPGRVRNIIVSDLEQFKDALTLSLIRNNIEYVAVNNEFHFLDKIYRLYDFKVIAKLGGTIKFAGESSDDVRVLTPFEMSSLKSKTDMERLLCELEYPNGEIKTIGSANRVPIYNAEMIKKDRGSVNQVIRRNPVNNGVKVYRKNMRRP